jgi:integrase
MQTHQIAISKQGALKDFRTLINTDGSISKGSAELYQHCMTKFGRFLDEQGIGWGEVSHRLGHASVAMTLDCYTHSDDKVVQYLSF